MQFNAKRELFTFGRSIISHFRGWVALLIFLIAIYSLFEGLALSLLLPILQYLGIGEQSAPVPWLTFVDHAFAYVGMEPSLVRLLALLGILFGVQQILFLIHKKLSAHLQSRYTLHWRTLLFKQVFASRWAYFTNTRGTDITNAIIRECERVNLAFYNLIDLVVSIVLAVIYVLLALIISWQAAIFLTVLGVAVYLLTRPILNKSVKAGHDITETNEAMTKSVHEYLVGAKLIKATGTEQQAYDDFSQHATRAAGLVEIMGFQPAQLRAAFELSGMLGLLLMIGIGVEKMQLNAGAILVTVYLFLRLHSRVSMIQQALNNLNFYLAGFTAASSVLRSALALEEKIDQGMDIQINQPPRILLDNVSVSYGEKKVLHSICLDIGSGETVAFVGSSGAGKSTLVDVILGLVQPRGGSVQVDDNPLPALAPQSWRRTVGYVGQDTFLFNASVDDNIRWANKDASEDEVLLASRKANAHEFIEEMNQGYETFVGDSGVRLSGGQRQRIGLARALLRDNKVLILDEATSALDSKSERAVMDAINGLRGNITILMIAHRLSTVRNADRIVVLDSGRIAESGTWEELMARNSVLRSMWMMQQGNHEDSEAANIRA